MKILNYEDIKVTLLRKTENPLDLMDGVSRVTMSKDFKTKSEKSKAIVKFLLKGNHTAPLEFIDYTFLIEGASRSFLSQITRHRMASFMSSSQHYMNYSDFPHAIMKNLTDEQKMAFEQSLNDSVDAYKTLINLGVPKYEARQVLPNSCAVNLYVKMNARSLMNFFNLRLCYRNTEEIQIVAEKMLKLCRGHFPELFDNIGPDCFQTNCKQGRMMADRCKEGKRWKQNV